MIARFEQKMDRWNKSTIHWAWVHVPTYAIAIGTIAVAFMGQ